MAHPDAWKLIWRPMHEAPVDGTPVLVWDGKMRAVARFLAPDRSNPVMVAMSDGHAGYWCLAGCAFGIKPIAWTYLTEAPPDGARP